MCAYANLKMAARGATDPWLTIIFTFANYQNFKLYYER